MAAGSSAPTRCPSASSSASCTPGSTIATGSGREAGAYFPASNSRISIRPQPSRDAAQLAGASWPSALTAPRPVTTVLVSRIRFGFGRPDHRRDAVEEFAERLDVGKRIHVEDDAVL